MASSGLSAKNAAQLDFSNLKKPPISKKNNKIYKELEIKQLFIRTTVRKL